MKVYPYVNFNGQCEEAMKFYEQVLDGKITFKMTWGEMPGKEQFPPETHNLIMHISLAIGDAQLLGADAPPGRYQRPKGANVSLHFQDKDKAERVFKALSENGEIIMDFQQTFWSPGFGMCVDRFGIPWMINTESSQ